MRLPSARMPDVTIAASAVSGCVSFDRARGQKVPKDGGVRLPLQRGRDGGGRVLTWGKGNDAQLGMDDRDDKLAPTPVSALASAEARVIVVMVASGYFHSAAVTEDGVHAVHVECRGARKV
jgi:alpha-tubulin suppressor-like RCC1 family protein